MRTSTLRVIALLILPSFAAAANFMPLGDVPGATFASKAYAISADGSVVVGYGTNENTLCTNLCTDPPELHPIQAAVRWVNGAAPAMIAGGMDSGSGHQPANAVAYGVSGDGSVIVGYESGGSNYDLAFRWSNGPKQSVDGFAATAVAADGTVIVGNYIGAPRATYWTQGSFNQAGAIALAPNGIDIQSNANAVSADGSVIAGGAYLNDSFQAFRATTVSNLMVGLGDLAGGASNSNAYGISSDGQTIVGQGSSAMGTEAFWWTEIDGMAGLGDLPGGGFSSIAYGISADSRIVIGSGTTAAGDEAFIWTQSGGMQRLFDVLIAQGATGLSGWTLKEARGISADGTRIAGWGINTLGQTEAFVAQISAVPIPPAAWLFGSALGAIGVLRRKMSG